MAAIADGRGIGRCNHFKVFPAAVPAQIELWQWGGVAFGELADAAGEGLRDAVQLALHGA